MHNPTNPNKMRKYLVTFKRNSEEWQMYLKAKNIREAEKEAKKIAKEYGYEKIWIYPIKPITHEI
jgi:hypothetical protein